ncbi:MAG: thiol peroxidase [Woeseia sp.]
MHQIRYLGTNYEIFGELPSIGSRASDMSLVNIDLRDMTLGNWSGKRKILNIFPSIDTPICAKSVIVFDQLSAGQEDLVMLMISYDLPFAHVRFREQHKLENVIQLSAIRHAGFGENYGVQIMEGPLAGMFARAIVVLDENDTVVHRQLVEDIMDEPDYAAALAALGIDADMDLVCD